jgi:hypothetical protein
MSYKTAAILMGSGPVMELGELARVMRNTDTQLAGALPQSRPDLMAEIERTMRALESYPTTPVLPDVELNIPMPKWADL